MDANDPRKRLITVTEQASVNGAPANLQYHGGGIGGVTATQPYQNTNGRNYDVLFSASYITGTHAFKVGGSDTIVLRDESLDDNIFNISYRFNNTIPNQITQRSTPYTKAQRQPAGIGLYVQDKWTIDRLTLNLGLRFDYLKITIPAQHLDPAPLVPNRNLDLPETDLVNWKDVTPRLAVAYDLFGTGKTALKTSINKYVVAQGVQGPYGDAIAPVNRLANFVTRTWNDQTYPVGDPRRSNYFPDCDLTNVLANGECGNVSDTNFGKPTPSTTVDPRVLDGFGVRPEQLGVLGQRPARGGAARVGGLRLLPPLVRQLRRDRQPGAGGRRISPRSPRPCPSTRGCPTAAATRSTGSSIATRTPRRWRPTTSSRWRATTATRSSSGTAST